ncbi:uncharacterized protein N7515_009387 [Penicillium bovifimosum]|uniref:SRR1-like domain-containing protein n=1 Tax=Penicillium bovifimosum TaxID=126998 RepID=A0A9W9GJJ0_9EURO|nr:uncharacterized protein N7515_009387 [Penicillium bovifimosum]KAJ5121426.1 hypothetical protein N7515_009387 [Penicillium bovifimosum]
MGDLSIFQATVPARWSRQNPNYREAPRALFHLRDTATLQEVETSIDRAYTSGVPFFTKRAIQHVWDQIKRNPAPGSPILFKDITGTPVACKVQTGHVEFWRRPDGSKLQYVYKEIILGYDCRASLRDHLANHVASGFRPQTYAPCPIYLQHVASELDIETKQITRGPAPLNREVTERSMEDKTQRWIKSPACDKLKAILSSSVKDHEINKIVAFSLGSPSKQWANDRGLEVFVQIIRVRSEFQHGLLKTLLEWLQGRGDKDQVRCYTQDPLYTEVDKQILGESGIEVIGDPRGWLEADERSVLFTVAPTVPVKEIIADITRPAVIIWDRVGFNDSLGNGNPNPDPDSPRVRQMMEGYECYEFGPHPKLFCNIVVYVRKSVAAPVPGEDGRFT